MLSKIFEKVKNPLFKNSFFIILNFISTAGFGLIFWMLAAKIYPKEDVGIATALLSSMALLILLTRFGLDVSLIRFFPKNDKSSIFTTSIVITTFFTVVLGLIFIIGIELWTPELRILSSLQNTAIYILFMVASSLLTLTSVSFYAIRKAEYGFYQSLIVGSRVFVLFPFIFLGAMGIFSAMGTSFILACIFSFIMLAKFGVRLSLKFDRGFLKEAFNFSAGNYISGLLMTAPNMLFPILVLNLMGAEHTAHYFIAFSINSILFNIPIAVSTSHLVEGSHGEGLKKTTKKALYTVFIFMIPAAIVLYFAGDWLLGLLGKDYASGALELLRIMIISSFFMAIISIYISIKKVQKDVKQLILLSGLIFCFLMGFGYIFLLWFGITGIGYAYIVGYGAGALIVGMLVRSERWV